MPQREHDRLKSMRKALLAHATLDEFAGSQEWGVSNIKLVTFVSSPEGIKDFQDEHPDVDIVTGSIDEGLGQSS